MFDDTSSTIDLVSKLRQGEDDVLAELFARYRGRLKRLVEFRIDQRLKGRVDASDVLQEVYIDAFHRRHHFAQKPSLSFFLWLREVTLQRLIDLHRRHVGAKMRDVRQEVSLEAKVGKATSASLAFQLVGHWASPSQIAMRAEALDQLQEALESMDPIDREVLALRHFEELTNNEIAELLGITKAGASNRYVRALSRLKDILESVPGFQDRSDPSQRPPA